MSMSGKETWNHRVIEYADPDGSLWYAIHEVHYLGGKPYAYTENPVPVCGDTIEDVRQVLKWMESCLSAPVLKETDFIKGSDSAERAPTTGHESP